MRHAKCRFNCNKRNNKRHPKNENVKKFEEINVEKKFDIQMSWH